MRKMAAPRFGKWLFSNTQPDDRGRLDHILLHFGVVLAMIAVFWLAEPWNLVPWRSGRRLLNTILGRVSIAVA